jgi:hypothetical protein
MTEAILKGALVKEARLVLPTSFVILRHEDHFTHGIPDISIDGNKKSSWWEPKYANPGFQCKGIQELTMLRLNIATYARFIIYWEKDKIKRTYIVEPKDIGIPTENWDVYEEGFNHKWVVSKMRQAHQ